MTTYQGSGGKPYGHVPGHQFHDVECTLRQLTDGKGWSCALVETWGSSQGTGRDETHGENRWRGNGDTPYEAVRVAIGKIPPDEDDSIRYANTAASKAIGATPQGGAS